MSLLEAVKARTAARGWVTRCSKKLKSLCEQETKDMTLFLDTIDEFDKKLSSLDTAQSTVELLLSEEKIEADIESAADFRDNAKGPRLVAAKILASLQRSSDPGPGQNNSGSVSTSTAEAKLPKLSLPFFSGDIKHWTGFWEQFEVTVDRSDLPDISKFSYLLSLLKGEARLSVQGLSLSASHYKTAVDILKQRYGRPERLIFCHIQDLLNINVPKNPKLTVLWEMYDCLQSHVRSLEALNISGAQYGVVLTPLILSRLPPDIRMEWAREGEQHESDLSFLLTFLLREIERRERSQAFVKEAPGAEHESRPPRMSTAAALHTTSTDKNCAICGRKGHPVHKCFNLVKITISDRKPVLQKAGLCFKCLKDRSNGHDFHKCPATCSRCKGRHHAVLCNNGTTTQTHTQKQLERSSESQCPDVKHVHNTHDDITKNNVSPTGVALCSTGNVSGNQYPDQKHLSSKKYVLLQTARVKVKGRRGVSDAVVLFDTGSDRTYISEGLVGKIGPDWVNSENVAFAAFGSSQTSTSEMRNVYDVCLQGGQCSEMVRATEIPIICASMYRPAVPESVLASLGGDVICTDVEGHVTVDILIGLDFYWRLMTPELVCLSDGLVAQQTVFGWVVSGMLSGEPESVSNGYIGHQLLCLNDVSEATIRKFWDLESVGVCDNESSVLDPVMSNFQKTVEYFQGRYVVAQPWKSESLRSKLLPNDARARQRLDRLTKKFVTNPVLEQRYNEALHEMEAAGVINEVPSEEVVSPHPTYYMPHRPVLKESSASTKVRPVFDASARGPNGLSLNDCLETGPCLLSNLVEILIRFRRWKVALTADIQKAFLQIKVRKQDQDVHRFLWRIQDQVRIMRFDRVPFGNKSSPFLLNATIQHHLSKYSSSVVVSELKENMYVDDWLTGADDDAEAHQMFNEANEVMGQAGMTFAKWSSNSDCVSEMLHQHFESKYLDSEFIKVLGLKWTQSRDFLSFGGIEIPPSLVVTKRMVLSFMARLFDPLGFLNPFMMVVKCLFQDLWKMGLNWDELVPEVYHSIFISWIRGLIQLKCWEIPRSYFEFPWRDIVHVQLHAFGDASEKAYGSCVYLRVMKPDNSWSASLVISKAKVAPLKKVTLPRLELMGALVCAKLVSFVRKALKLPDDTVYHCWTDSTVTLSWIRNDPHKWKPFVGNRVSEIHSLTSPDHWHHCPGDSNPADLVTRGISAQELVESKLWLHGPPFLSEENRFSEVAELGERKLKSQCVEDSVDQESRVKSSTHGVTLMTSDGSADRFLDVERWSSLGKSLRVVGWILRFINNLKNSAHSRLCGELSYRELSHAKVVLLKSVQAWAYAGEFRLLSEGQSVSKKSNIFRLSPFIGRDGLLHVQGRLQCSGLSDAEKHPIIVPKGHLGTLLAQHIHLTQKHAGVNSMLIGLRDQYWLVGARNTCKKVKRQCVSCQRQDVGAGDQAMAPLPSIRVTPAPPFAVTGLDHGGPLFCCDYPGRKFYVLLFTCAIVRAVHLELVDNLSSEASLLALRRFIARRGLPSIIMSDNAKGFKSAADKHLQLFGPDGPEWRFIAPRAPWWGGWWERLIGSVKSALRKSVGKKSLTRTELETSLQEIEGCVNSRPLTYTGDGVDSSFPLTPSHFLLGRTVNSKPSAVTEVPVVSSKDLILRLEYRNQVIEEFWFTWVKQYIRSLPPLQNSQIKGNLVKGSVVLIKDEQTRRLQWPLGVIQKVFPGRDGLIRTVEVRTAKNVMTRPIQHIFNLEINDRISDHVTQNKTPETVSTEVKSSPDEAIIGDSICIKSRVDQTCDAQSEAHISSGTSQCNAKQGQSKPIVSRIGRKIKPPQRLDL